MLFELMLTVPHVPVGGEGVQVGVGDLLSDGVLVGLRDRLKGEALKLRDTVGVCDGVKEEERTGLGVSEVLHDTVAVWLGVPV